MIIPPKWFNFPVSVRTYTGSGSLGRTFANPVAVLINKDERRSLVSGRDGEQEVAEVTLRTEPADGALFTPESTVDLGDRVVQVITSKPFDKYGVTVYQEVVCK